MKNRHYRVPFVSMTLGLAVFCASGLFAWGQEGHRITAELAERHLDEAAAAAVEEILGGESLAQVATWPDEIRSYPSWDCTQPYHYVTVPIGAGYPDEGVAAGDSVQALVYFSDLLRDPEASAEDRRMALSFIIHLVGDIHQPLHNGRGCDRGGNRLTVDWFGEDANFHTVWDSLLIQSEDLSFTEWADFLDHADADRTAALQASTPVEWVGESQLMLDDAYTCFTDADRCPCFCGDCEATGKSRFGGCGTMECSLMVGGAARLKYAYKAVNIAVVREQLLHGGLRLAGMLNRILGEAAADAGERSFEEMASQFRALPNYDPEMMTACRGTVSVAAVEGAE